MMFAVVAISSCASQQVEALSGEWVIEQVNGKDTEGEMTPFIGFNPQDSTIYGSNSCNRFFGGIVYDEADASVISFSNVASTRMMCANSPMEDEIQSAINNVAGFSYTDQGDVLLLDEDKSVLMLLTPKTSGEEMD